MLVDLDTGRNQVFYAAPLFHTVEQLNRFYLTKTVSDNSFYIPPRWIDRLDGDPHHVAFDARRSWVFSEPQEVHGIPGDQFPQDLRARFAEDRRPMREGPLHDALEDVERIIGGRALKIIADETAGVEPLDDLGMLRRLADLSLRYFSAQLFVVHAAGPPDERRPPVHA